VVAAPTLGEAQSVEAALVDALDDDTLADRVEFRASAGTAGTVAFADPQIGQVGGDPACTWQVWVSDPALPSPDEGIVALPLAPGDRVPAGPDATFRIGYTGLLQSTIYAFGESEPGRIRDLTRISDINIPVIRDAAEELLVLVRSRQPIAFLDEVRQSLQATEGQPLDLGETYALADMTTGRTRGIGSNIQVIEPGMVVRGAHHPLPTEMTSTPVADALAEMCLFTVVSTAVN
jgi:hypothetical protein